MQQPENYRYKTVIPIRYGDMDTLGHVNNAKYLTYLEQSRISYIRDRGLWDGSLSAQGLIIARIEIDYRAPISMDDGQATVWTRVSRIGNKSFDMTQSVMVARGEQTITAAEAKTVIVVYDYTAAATVAIPEAWRSLIADYEQA
jgi:acyl-CoA thioester hydrolase